MMTGHEIDSVWVAGPDDMADGHGWEDNVATHLLPGVGMTASS
jgi:hypothetical protein